MRHTSVVLAVVAVMVTVLVFSVPAFALSLPENGKSDPAGPGGTNPETGVDNLSPNMIGGEPRGELEDRHDPQAAEGTIGELASDYTVHATEVGAPGGHHIIDTLDNNPDDPLESPGDLVQLCRDTPQFCPDLF